MDNVSPAVVDVFRCIESIEKRRNEVATKGSGSAEDERRRRGRRRSQAADSALRERYYAVLQRRDGNSSLSERIKTLRRMVLAQGLPGDNLEKSGNAAPRPGSSGGEQRHGRETMAAPSSPQAAIAATSSTTTTTATTSAASSRRSSPSPSSTQHHPRRRESRSGGVGGGTGGGSGTSCTGQAGAADPGEDHQCSLRGLVWKVLLGTIHTDSLLYTRLVAKGPSSEDVKIKEDTFRTFPRDEEFRRRVHEHKLSRINNAYVRLNRPDGEAIPATDKRGSGGRGRGEGVRGANDSVDGGEEQEQPEADDVSGGRDLTRAAAGGGGDGGGGEKGRERAPDGGKGVYVQGMMVLCAPLLFVMPEVDAFFCFNSLLNQHMPRYVAANLDGVHAGCALVDRVLSMVDPVLFNYLESKFLTANIYAFPLVMSLHACVPPLEEAVKLWDAVFSFGVHLEILICVAQCVSLRDTLLQDPNPYRHLNRNLPPLDAELLVSMAFSLIPHLPPELMDEIAQHPFMEEPLHGNEEESSDHNDGVGGGGGGVDGGRS